MVAHPGSGAPPRAGSVLEHVVDDRVRPGQADITRGGERRVGVDLGLTAPDAVRDLVGVGLDGLSCEVTHVAGTHRASRQIVKQ
jgi:hypothetical protein